MKLYLVFSVIVLVIFASLLLAVQEECKVTIPETDIKAVVAGNSQFAFDLYAKLKDDANALKPYGNLFFSPYSISTALAMTYAGARGETEKQMKRVLHFRLSQDRLHPTFAQLERQLKADYRKAGYQLNIANALWGHRGYNFLLEFLSIIEESYGPKLKLVDFGNKKAACKTINSWIEKNTEEKIKGLIDPHVLHPNTKLILTNAIYFKGDWMIQFDKKKTTDAEFILSANRKVVVPMMCLKSEFKYDEADLFQMIELPYKGNKLSMIVILPRKIDYLERVEKELLKSEKLGYWFQRLRKQEIVIYLPKFKINWGTFELKDILKSMGMSDAFASKTVDFSGMDGEPNMLFIHNVLHKAFVEVNEEGTESAAATAVSMALRSAPKHVIFRADHPFIFLIKDNCSGSILFMGRVMNLGNGDNELLASQASTTSISDLVSEIVKKAKSHDKEFFNKLLDSPYRGQEQKLIDMILRSDMLNNFEERLTDKNSSQARLNYHYLEKGCHFQIDLIKKETGWLVKRIWFCK